MFSQWPPFQDSIQTTTSAAFLLGNGSASRNFQRKKIARRTEVIFQVRFLKPSLLWRHWKRGLIQQQNTTCNQIQGTPAMGSFSWASAPSETLRPRVNMISAPPSSIRAILIL